MPVTRCPQCHRGLAGYLDGEKELGELTPTEILTEMRKLEAKSARISQFIEDLQAGVYVQQAFPEGTPCGGCEHGWREFGRHRKDLEQLTITEARAAFANARRWVQDLQDTLV